MLTEIAQVVPLGLGIAINPIAIVAGILLLASADPRRNGIGFVLGWTSSLTVLLLLALFVFQEALKRGVSGVAGSSVVLLGLGLVLIGAALWTILRRQSGDDELPRWMGVLDRFGPFRSFGLGLFLAGVSVKNLALVIAAGAVLGQSGLQVPRSVISSVIFVAAGSGGILVPFLMRVFGGTRGDARLAGWRDWFGRHMRTITAIVLLLLGLLMAGRGIGGLV